MSQLKIYSAMECIEFTKQIWTIESFLSPEFCDDLIQKSENLGYQEATVSLPEGGKMMKGLRDNYRVNLEDKEFSDKLFQSLKPDLPVVDSLSTPVALSEKIRFYRYDENQRFKRHIDGRVRYAVLESRLTFMVYLNDDYQGGETKFDDALIRPLKGMALLFIHEQKHESLPIEAGKKYVLRSDVFYELPANGGLT